MKCPRCNGRMRVERDELDNTLEAVCMACGHHQAYQEEEKPYMETRISSDPFADARKTLETALNAARSELGVAESRIDELRGQVKRLENAFLALTGQARPKREGKKGTHTWSPEQRAAQADRMRQTMARKNGTEAAAAS